jgi:hypothetical protein
VNVVPRITTPISEGEAAGVVVRAYHDLFGRDPTKRALVAMLSLIWIETARGRAVKNHNLGNITSSETRDGDAWRPPWFDFDGGDPAAMTDRNLSLHEQMLQGKAPRAFRAYGSAEIGAADFVRQLRSSFPEVLEAAELGDPDLFRIALSQKYSKDYANPAATKAFAEFFDLFDRKIVRPPGSLELPGGREVRLMPIVLAVGIVAAAGAIFWATLRVKPGARAPARAALRVAA